MTNEEKITAAIKSQRWFRFKNKPKVIFDRDTALLWADPKYFPYSKNGAPVSYNSSEEVYELLRGKNAHGFGNCTDWRLPTRNELKKMIEDKTFPDQFERIWRVNSWATTDVHPLPLRYVYVLPCSHSLVPETPQSTLEIFVENKLEPIFADDAITQLYRKIYIEKKSSPSFEDLDCATILADYDLDAVSRSPIQYYAAVRNLVDALLSRVNKLERHVDNRRAVDTVRAQLFKFHARAESFNSSLRAAIDSADPVAELAKLEREPRPTFAFLVETIVGIVRDNIDRQIKN